mgnify:CR=1 FL=1|jgi:hypothetical protein
MHHIGFRLTDNTDPEERLEEAALWKAMKDHYGARISPVPPGSDGGDDWIMFGRIPRFETGREPVPGAIEYWNDPAFLENCGREFRVVGYDGLRDAVGDLHARGIGAFVKSTRMKHYVCRVPVGADIEAEIGDMAFSFMDGGPDLMVQALCEVAYEYRFFVVGREIVTQSPVMVSLTPLDHADEVGFLHETPNGGTRIMDAGLIERYFELAGRVAAGMVPEHAVVDVGLVDGRPAVIEMNPMRLGQIGLYACDVRALAVSSERLIRDFVPRKRPPFTVPAEDEEEFRDDLDDAAPPSFQG